MQSNYKVLSVILSVVALILIIFLVRDIPVTDQTALVRNASSKAVGGPNPKNLKIVKPKTAASLCPGTDLNPPSAAQIAISPTSPTGQSYTYGSTHVHIADVVVTIDSLCSLHLDQMSFTDYYLGVAEPQPLPPAPPLPPLLSNFSLENTSGPLTIAQTHACSDGVENDADGGIDALDLECFTDFDEDGIYDTTAEPYTDSNGDTMYNAPEILTYDVNGNGSYDPGDGFTDYNFNGVFDPLGEPFIDTNSNGIWDDSEYAPGKNTEEVNAYSPLHINFRPILFFNILGNIIQTPIIPLNPSNGTVYNFSIYADVRPLLSTPTDPVVKFWLKNGNIRVKEFGCEAIYGSYKLCPYLPTTGDVFTPEVTFHQ